MYGVASFLTRLEPVREWNPDNVFYRRQCVGD
jgi:hypothetical protein